MKIKLDKLLSLALVLGLFANIVNALDLNSNLKAYWPLDGDTKDKSGGGHNGKISGNPLWVMAG